MSTGDAGTSPTEGASIPKDNKDGGGKRKGHWQQRSGNKSGTTTTATPRHPKFEGKCDDLKGHVYDCSDSRQADQFARTTKEIAEYVGRTYKYGGDTRLAVENLAFPKMVEPEDPPDGASKTKIKIWERDVEEFCRRQHNVREHIKTLYSLVWGQCSDIMRQRIEALDEFDKMSTDDDGIALLIAIKAQTFNFQSQKYLPHAMHETKRRFYFFSQGKLTTQMYHEQFQNLVEVIETIKGNIGVDPGIELLVATELKKNVGLLTNAEKKDAQDRYLAVAFLLGSDRSRYGKLIENLENEFLQGRNNYPKTVTSAYNLLINWKQDPRNLLRRQRGCFQRRSLVHQR